MSERLQVARTGIGGVVARVTLTRPKVHNAFDASLIAELRTTFSALANEPPDELRAVVLAGEGPSFCAGADIDWMRAAMRLDVEGNEQDAMAMADMFEAVDTCPVPPPTTCVHPPANGPTLRNVPTVPSGLTGWVTAVPLLAR